MVALSPPVPGRTRPTSVTNHDHIQNRPIRNRQVQYGNTKHVVHWIYKYAIAIYEQVHTAYDRCMNTGGSLVCNSLFRAQLVQIRCREVGFRNWFTNDFSVVGLEFFPVRFFFYFVLFPFHRVQRPWSLCADWSCSPGSYWIPYSPTLLSIYQTLISTRR